MRSKSQKLMNEIGAYVDQYHSKRHTVPSVNETAKGVVIAMNDLDMLRYDGAFRTIATRPISKFSESTVPAPVVRAVSCGTPEEENIQEYVSHPVSFFVEGEFCILKASGDSMADAGIEDSDIVLALDEQAV